MRRKKSKPNYRKIALRLPDLDRAKASVLNSLSSPQSRRNYRFAMDQFIAWYCSAFSPSSGYRLMPMLAVMCSSWPSME
jgi:hypothetical protein